MISDSQKSALVSAIQYLTQALLPATDNHDTWLKDARRELERAFPTAPTPEVDKYAGLISPSVPKGYDTILGYLAKEQPEVLDLMFEPVADTIRDGFAIKARCVKDGVEPRKVTPGQTLVDMGITEINAYPVEYLTARFG